MTSVALHNGAMEEHPHAEIGRRIRALRQKLGYTMADFADVNGWQRTQLVNWETGHRRITVDAAALLRSRYGVTLDWIYLGNSDGLSQSLAKSLASILKDMS